MSVLVTTFKTRAHLPPLPKAHQHRHTHLRVCVVVVVVVVGGVFSAPQIHGDPGTHGEVLRTQKSRFSRLRAQSWY